jgi:hypothetical protein
MRERLYPTFLIAQKFGPAAWRRGFGIVFEVKDINLKIPTEVDVSETNPPPLLRQMLLRPLLLLLLPVNQMQGMLLTRLRTGSNGTNAAEQ